MESGLNGVELDDQTRILELLRRTSLPSSEILNSAEEVLVMGVALFATQIIVWTGIFFVPDAYMVATRVTWREGPQHKVTFFGHFGLVSREGLARRDVISCYTVLDVERKEEKEEKYRKRGA